MTEVVRFPLLVTRFEAAILLEGMDPPPWPHLSRADRGANGHRARKRLEESLRAIVDGEGRGGRVYRGSSAQEKPAWRARARELAAPYARGSRRVRGGRGAKRLRENFP